MQKKKIPFEEHIANNIIKALKEGTAPWVKPWRGSELSEMVPINLTTNKPYNGINFVNLLVTAMNKGYTDPRWMTFNQAKSVGAKVQKGEKASLVKFYKFSEMKEVLDKDGKPVLDEKGKPVKEEIKLENPKVMFFSVFNAQQCENVPQLERVEIQESQREFEAIEAAEKILENSGADIRNIEGNKAYYSPLADFIVLPKKEQFVEAGGEMGYYSTALHELGHWSGHESRLNRDMGGGFGTPSYAKEELRAEIGSFMLCSKLGLDFDPEQHYAYIDSWVKVLKEDPKEITRASRDALKITNFIMDLEKEKMMSQEQNKTLSKGARDVANRVQNDSNNISRESVFTEKTYLIVKYKEKEAAKRAGAKWDREAKSWYAPAGAPKEKLSPWMFEQSESQALDPASEFKEILEKNGFVVNGLPLLDGKIHRIDVADKKRNNKNGWYRGFSDGRPNAVFGDYSKGQDRASSGMKWKSMSSEFSTGYDPAKAAEIKRENEAKKAVAEKELLESQLKTADILNKEFTAAPVANDNHPYLTAKGVKNYDLKVDKRGNLLMPLRDIDGKLWAVQRIGRPDKKTGKTFKMIGAIQTKEEKAQDIKHPAKMDGTFFIIDSKNFSNSKKIAVTEGYSTGATVHEATNLPVVVAVHSGNLEKVAKSLAEKYPQKQIIIAGDNDISNEFKGKENIGKIKAEAAALAVGGEVALPSFTKEELSSGASDWNDLAKSRGIKEVKKQLNIALKQLKNKEVAQKINKSKEQNQHQNKIRRREVVRKQSLSITK